MSRRIIVSLVFLVSSLVPNQRAAGREMPRELLEMSVNELMNLEVYTASRKDQKLADAAAAVFVITQEDIRRSGATSIPELLRMAPGVEVAHIDANKWAVSARGFNDRFSNKLLVLIDGRSVYTPVFSGVVWEVKDTLLEDIDRIEVIRGPGAALWGANAVNGVINIITKNARDTQGGLVTGGGGTEERGFGAVRYGARINEEACSRVYAKYFNRDDGRGRDDQSAFDAWNYFRTGFRTDWQASNDNTLVFMGDIYHGDANTKANVASLQPPYSQTQTIEGEAYGAYALTRWDHAFSAASALQFQLYYDWDANKSVLGGYTVHTWDADFQHRFAIGERQELIWGSSVRYHEYEFSPGLTIVSEPDVQNDLLLTAFFHDDITLIADRLHFIFGSKFLDFGQSGSIPSANRHCESCFKPTICQNQGARCF